jgi:hypothetical protein
VLVVLLVLLVAVNCASQLFRLETLPIVMSISAVGQIGSEYNINDTQLNSCEPGNKKADTAREQLLPILTGGKLAHSHCRPASNAAGACRSRPILAAFFVMFLAVCWLAAYHQMMKHRTLRALCGTLAITIAATVAAPTWAANPHIATEKPKLVVLDIELTGDLGGPQFTAEHEARLRMESDKLRQELEQSGLYTLVDGTPAQPLITKLKSQQSYLHDCNGCDLEIGRQLGANQVLVTWVDRVSGLILSLTYEFHDVSSGQIVGRKSYDFRGDNDSAWTHAIKYMVRDLKETAAAHTAAN